MFIGEYSVHPYLRFHDHVPLGPEFIRELNINTHQFGLLLSSYTFAAAAAGILATYYVDRFERRQLLVCMPFSSFYLTHYASTC